MRTTVLPGTGYCCGDEWLDIRQKYTRRRWIIGPTTTCGGMPTASCFLKVKCKRTKCHWSLVTTLGRTGASTSALLEALPTAVVVCSWSLRLGMKASPAAQVNPGREELVAHIWICGSSRYRPYLPPSATTQVKSVRSYCERSRIKPSVSELVVSATGMSLRRRLCCFLVS